MEQDEDGRYVVRFPDLPEALTDGAYEGEALAEAAIASPKRLPAALSMARKFRRQALIGRQPLNFDFRSRLIRQSR
jgi:hypothetical protein